MTVGGMGFIPERLLMMMMMITIERNPDLPATVSDLRVLKHSRRLSPWAWAPGCMLVVYGVRVL